MDANEDVRSSFLTDFFLNVGMEEKVLSHNRGNPPPATFQGNQSNTPIDSFWGSIGLQIDDAGYSEFDGLSDHRRTRLQITCQEATGQNAPYADTKSITKLNLDDARVVKKYNKLVKQAYKKHNIIELSADLRRLTANKETNRAIELHQYLSETIETIRLHIAGNIRRIKAGYLTLPAIKRTATTSTYGNS